MIIGIFLLGLMVAAVFQSPFIALIVLVGCYMLSEVRNYWQQHHIKELEGYTNGES